MIRYFNNTAETRCREADNWLGVMMRKRHG